MEELILHGSRILVGAPAGELSRHLPPRRVIAITNAAVRAAHAPLLAPFETIEMGDGETSKTLETVEQLAGELVRREADRETFLLGVGGGIVCDVTGFLASIYMRGCHFGFVPTTLLAQVDAGIGGKNGVNFHGYKNMLGVFAPPEIVICDPALTRTLPPRTRLAGFSEIVKAAMIADAPLFDYLERHVGSATADAPDEETMRHLISAALRVKAAIVEEDEREHGRRRHLNLGHTFAHAIESLSDHSHGEAVSIGLSMASRLSVRLGLMTDGERTRVENLLTRFSLPTRLPLPLSVLLPATRADKKRVGEDLRLILPRGIGHCVERLFPFTELEGLLTGLQEKP